MELNAWTAAWLSPAVLDGVLVGVVCEFLILWIYLARRSWGRWVVPLFLYLASGALLLAAVRTALAGNSEGVLAGLLAASGITHLLSLRQLRRRVVDEDRPITPHDPELC